MMCQLVMHEGFEVPLEAVDLEELDFTRHAVFELLHSPRGMPGSSNLHAVVRPSNVQMLARVVIVTATLLEGVRHMTLQTFAATVQLRLSAPIA
jgi:hypothetical protein